MDPAELVATLASYFELYWVLNDDWQELLFRLGPEPFGIVFIEALSAGLPVVTTEIGAAPEIVDEECGMLVPKENVAALASALRTLLSDETTRVGLGRKGPDRAAALCDPASSATHLYRTLSEMVG